MKNKKNSFRIDYFEAVLFLNWHPELDSNPHFRLSDAKK